MTNGAAKHIPIFVISCDRLKVLHESIESYYKYLNAPIEVVIIDNNTTFEKTQNYLLNLEKNGIKVYRYGPIREIRCVIPRINEVIEDWSQHNPNFDYYVVTDPDIAFHEGTPKDIIPLYTQLLHEFKVPRTAHTPWRSEGDISPIAIGPSLKIDDIPDYYPLKNYVVTHWAHQSSSPRPKKHKYYRDNIVLTHHCIDTTWGLLQKSTKYYNLMPSISVGPPYNARHLDWYINPDDASDDQIYYAFREKCITYYSKGFEYETKKYGRFYAKRKGEN